MHLFARTRPLGAASLAREVRFLGLSGPGDPPASHRLEATWPAPDIHAFTARILRVAASAPLDVLHFHYAVPFARIAEDVRRRLWPRIPAVVGTLHGTDVSHFGRDVRTGPALGRRLAGTDALTTVSRHHAALAGRTFALRRPPVVIPNFVDVRRFSPPPHGVDGTQRPRIVHVSNFRPVKDPGMVARIFARVRRTIDAELWLVGDGDAMASVREVVRREGVEGDVRFFGLRHDVAPIVASADVLLVTSRMESFCLVALEAAACAVPTVGTRVGGLPEVVLDGDTGFLFDPRDERSGAEAVLRLLRDPALRSRMGRAALHRARRLSADAVVPRYESLYRRVVGAVRDERVAVKEAAG